MSHKDIVLFDMDGTISLNHHRQYLLQRTPKDWNEWNKRCIFDHPHHPIIEIANKFFRDPAYEVWVATGRSEDQRANTMRWMEQHRMYVTDLVMRPMGDYTEDILLKKNWVDIGRIPKDRIFCVFEDRTRCVDMWRSLNLTCLQVAPGDF